MTNRFYIAKKHIKLRPAQQIALSFLFVILTGTFLLALPISNKAEGIPLIDHLFTATSAVCVTGLASVIPIEVYTVFGQTVIIFLMQIGGLGLMTLIAIFLLAIGGRLAHHEKMVIAEATNIGSMSGLGNFLGFIIGYTLIFEFIGMILLSLVFVPEFGWTSGLFKALFVSVSAFCNAGFDNIGAASLQPYVSNVIVNLTVSSLIIMGGLGFTVWFDLTKSVNSILKQHHAVRRVIQHLQVHVKLVFVMTLLLITTGWLFLLLVEFSNPASLGPLSFFDKIMAAYFQSVTLRTAGFATLNIATLYPASQLMMMAFMFIGGSPGGTAGGIKTTTFALVILMVVSEILNRENLTLFKRTISRDIARRALSVMVLSFTVVFTGMLLLTMSEKADFLVIAFEAFSAIGTVGLSMGITPYLTDFGKIVIILLMFIGRIGPVAVAFSLKNNKKFKRSVEVAYPTGQVIVG
ncbi:MAG: potassium transporter TrkG [Erysipelotrichaceae bacterium]|nr:potassium transporter TrkG [Erysipelotrichaceae bacterium]MDP3305057.1 potassium transporter TrkG [Erysipelotrichaceae bacterium]